MDTSNFSRGQHVAEILTREHAWRGYESLHAPLFAANNLQKYVEADKDYNVVANNRASTPDELQLTSNASTVRHEDFLIIQQKIQEIRRRRLNGILDLYAAGLTVSADITKQLIGYEKVSAGQNARQEMNPSSFDNNKLVITEQYTPLPIQHSSFSVEWRQQGFDYKSSMGLSECTRLVAERNEKTLFLGDTGVVVTYAGASQPLYGYTTHPNRATATISNWATVGNRDAIVAELNAQIGLMFSAQATAEPNSIMVYVANTVWQNLQLDYVAAQPSKTIYDRLKDIPSVKDIKPAEFLTGDAVVLVEMTDRTVQLAVASDIVAVPHVKTNPMAPQWMTVYSAMTPILRVDSANVTGIRHLTHA